MNGETELQRQPSMIVDGRAWDKKFEWPRSDTWRGGWAIAGSAWIFGKWASKNEYELALGSKNASEQALHLDNAATMNLASNLGAGFIAYEYFKLNPRATSVVLALYFGFGAFISSASLPKGSVSKFARRLPVADPVAAGWGWEHGGWGGHHQHHEHHEEQPWGEQPWGGEHEHHHHHPHHEW
jgi:hypothetical protein